MEEQKKNKIHKEHLEIYNCFQLADFIMSFEKQLAKENIFIEFERIGEKEIVGYINDVFFLIEYVRGRTCVLEMEDGFPTYFNALRKILSPVMWVVDENSRAPIHFCSPIVGYITKAGTKVIEWNNYDPMQKLKGVAMDYYNGVPVTNLEIYYPEVTLESLKEDHKYGKFSGFFPQDMLAEIEAYEEFELFYNILSLTDLYEKYYESSVLLRVDASEKLDCLEYMVAYLLQKTENFGIKSEKPSVNPIKPTKEQRAWIEWWANGYKKEIERKPNLVEEWNKFPKGFDPNFRPEGSYKEFIKKEEKKIVKKEKRILNTLIDKVLDDGPYHVGPADEYERE